MRALFLIVAGLILGGCQTQLPTGKGPITLSPQVTSYYQNKYLKNGPVSFFVSADGRSANYTYCSQTIDCSSSGAKWTAHSNCEKNSGQKCFIFDEGGDVVWDGPVNFNGASRTNISTPVRKNSVNNKEWTDLYLCGIATDLGSGSRDWDTSTSDLVRNAIKEAKRRNLSPPECEMLISGKAGESTPDNYKDLEEGLEAIKRLLDKGLITEDEAAKKRTELLSRIK